MQRVCGSRRGYGPTGWSATGALSWWLTMTSHGSTTLAGTLTTTELERKMNPETCPECGADAYKIRYYDKVLNEKMEIAYRFKHMQAEHGLQQAEWELKEISLSEGMKYLQQKTRKQTAVIKRLEEKIRRLNQQPYKEEE